METMILNQQTAAFFNQITRSEPGKKTGLTQGGNLHNHPEERDKDRHRDAP
jgi:hypothetical protein